MRKRSKKIFFTLVIPIIILAIAVSFLKLLAYADEGLSDGENGDAGPGAGGLSGSCPPFLNGNGHGNCQSLKTFGAYWIKIPVKQTDMTIGAFLERINRNKIRDNETGKYYDQIAVKDNEIRKTSLNCWTGREEDSYVYVLVSQRFAYGVVGFLSVDAVTDEQNKNGGPGVHNFEDFEGKAGAPGFESYPFHWEADGSWVPLGNNATYSHPGETVTVREALDTFNEHAEWYRVNRNMVYNEPGLTSSNNLGYFCHTPGGEDPDPPSPRLACGAYYTNEKADTRTRIAVQNMTLDGSAAATDSNGNVNIWKARDDRKDDYSQDSGFTDDNSKVITTAKPGDTVRFYHSFCMAVRYGMWTPSQDTWGEAQYHSEKYTALPAQSAKIESTGKYLFDDSGALTNVNNQLKNVTKNEDLFSDPGVDGVEVDSSKSAISIYQPLNTSSDYKCEYFQSQGAEYIQGGYQIPGFDTNENCTSATKTGNKNPVGTEITQSHKFDSLKMWEMYGHDNNTNLTAENFEDATKVNGHVNSGQFKYKTTNRNYGEKTKVASVAVPYNFESKVSTSLNNNEISFQGSTIETKFTWEVAPRENTRLSNKPYATVTPSNGNNKTKVQMVEYLMAPGKYNVVGNTLSDKDPCAYYGGEQCKTVDFREGNQNPRGIYNGNLQSATKNRTIPDNDEYVGYKYCIAVGFFPSDSHDRGKYGNGAWQDYQDGHGGALDAGEFWNISNASCVTIAKKPNFQVWNGSIYTEGKIKTSITSKRLNAKMGEDGGTSYIFGSWADYGVYPYGTNNFMASGAMLGYKNSRYDLSGEGGQLASSSTNQKLSPQTISNNSQDTGNSGISAGAAYLSSILRLESRYKDKARTFANNSSRKTIYTSKTGMHYVYYSGNLNTNDLTIDNSSAPNHNALSKTNGNIMVGLGNGKDDNTLVINVDGNLKINTNICLGSCSNLSSGSSGSTMLRNYASGTRTANSAALPQVLIFAKNIEIDESVTRIDAWLIVPDGKINTCAGHTMNNLTAKDAKGRYSSYGGNCDRTLVINGPVFTSHLDLLRTAGATHGASDSSSISDPRDRILGANRLNDDTRGSTAPAEIFNLRADAYIWAYTQAQRYSEAVVTYTRELAPRY